MTYHPARPSGLRFSLAIAAVALASVQAPVATAAEKAVFDPKASVPAFGDASCMYGDGKVKGSALNGRDILEDRNGCLTVQGDGAIYYVLKPTAKKPCKKVVQGRIATTTAGSAGANECKD